MYCYLKGEEMKAVYGIIALIGVISAYYTGMYLKITVVTLWALYSYYFLLSDRNTKEKLVSFVAELAAFVVIVLTGRPIIF